ncbi:hypothetical protein WJX72_008585 [[Myrmecia] bisecta]|uniref:AAA+ ATPase domain-containing protein n=1 Tax=[Myrmecia] bisecta TaxID=41462 RepID=A0AAW1R814_9CHLO
MASKVVRFPWDPNQTLSALVRTVVEDLERNLEPILLDGDCPAIGIKDRVDEVLDLPCMQQTGGVRWLGLTGMGGIGKTTLAKALHNRLKSDFIQSDVCYVEDVRDTTSKYGIQQVQQQMLKDLCNLSERPVGNMAGKIALQRKLEGRRKLLVLDDVGESDWELLPPQDPKRNFLSLSVLGPGSIVIITSREGGILCAAGCSLVEVDFLTPESSQRLFETYAGDIKVPADVVMSVVKACDGLPLSLKVMAGHLAGKEEQEWHQTLDKLAKGRDFPGQEKLFASLRISYDNLDSEDKQLFLDIACLLAASLPRRIGATDIQTLVDKYLLTVDKEGNVRMHDQLRDLGVSIERSAMPRTRLWGEDAAHHFPGLTKKSPLQVPDILAIPFPIPNDK